MAQGITGTIQAILSQSSLQQGGNVLLSAPPYIALLNEIENPGPVITIGGFNILGLNLEGLWLVCYLGNGAEIYELGEGKKYVASIEGFVSWREAQIKNTNRIRAERQEMKSKATKEEEAVKIKRPLLLQWKPLKKVSLFE